ncbi:MAG TPA: glycosyltransferase family 4 protein, partial [Tianweitania sediminis]|nr:glycosyltransferase family 4 protein [Tianweitania sediminis]
IRIPFRFDPPAAAHEAMAQAQSLDFTRYGGGQIDAMICLKFPAYLIEHPNRALWLLHQHRPAYDLYNTPYGWTQGHRETDKLRAEIIAADKKSIGGARAVFTIAERVSQRLMQHNKIPSRALYHPPSDEAAFHCAEAMPYIFAPSRLEILKRQDLLLQAVAACSRPLQVIFGGTGGRRSFLEDMARDLGITDRVRFLGEISRAEMIALYSNATAVFFGPLDEDYGYVTLEAMLSSKPVITCTDSGGPLEFVVHGETGLVCAPNGEAIAEALLRLMDNPAQAAAMGQAGRVRYDEMAIGWQPVVDALLAGALGGATSPAQAA